MQFNLPLIHSPLSSSTIVLENNNQHSQCKEASWLPQGAQQS